MATNYPFLAYRYFRLLTISSLVIMRTNLRNISLIILLVAFGSCEEKYWPDLGGRYQNLLVVDGMITNEPGPYIVRLSQSTPVSNQVGAYVSGYQIIIMDDHGNTETLHEINPGEYSTDPDGIQGVAGRKYKIEITSVTGEVYQSEYETLKQPTDIESVFAKLEYRQNNEVNYDIAGYQFYLNTAMAQHDTNYYLWNMTATYKYQADLKIRFIFDGTLRPFYNSDSLRICYKTQIIKEIFTYNTSGLNKPVLTNFPLHYVSTETRDLSFRYSLMVKQLSISETAYNFWSAAREQNSDIGDLHSRQPYQIRGNISNLNNPGEPVLGLFLVAGVSEKRIFVNRPDPPVRMRYPVCVAGEGAVENFPDIFFRPERFWPVYATFHVDGRPALPPQVCMNCELSGGVLQKPGFWIDD
ncbi:MAG: hypothetical protein B6D64_01090 [Bacteroidetes bacterium 4484_276]|nr:MAG: hypothetical protein B6D64_01090 [Bacteroidetes bacterium 4484_276]